MLVSFLKFAPKLQEILQTPRRLAGPLKGPCHSDRMLVHLPKHGDRKPSYTSYTVQQLHTSDILDTQRAAETHTDTPMQEQGEDQNGNEDI